MRRWIAASATVAGSAAIAASCGRLGFDARTHDAGGSADSAVADTVPPVPVPLVMTGSSTGDTTAVASLQLTIPEVTAGDLLIVAIADHHGNAVASIVDGSGRPFAPTGARAVMASTSSEIWYEANAMPTNSVTVTMSPASNFDAWVTELSGAHPGPPVTIAMSCLQYPPTIALAPVTTTVANELVFSVVMAQYPLYVTPPLPPFTGSEQTGNGAGYYVAPQPGTYSETYGVAMGSGMAAMTCASTAAWLPGP